MAYLLVQESSESKDRMTGGRKGGTWRRGGELGEQSR